MIRIWGEHTKYSHNIYLPILPQLPTFWRFLVRAMSLNEILFLPLDSFFEYDKAHISQHYKWRIPNYLSCHWVFGVADDDHGMKKRASCEEITHAHHSQYRCTVFCLMKGSIWTVELGIHCLASNYLLCFERTRSWYVKYSCTVVQHVSHHHLSHTDKLICFNNSLGSRETPTTFN